jgi:hypothetical protein
MSLEKVESAIIPKLGKAELLFFVLHFYSMRSFNLQSFLLIPLMVSELCPGQSSKCKKRTKGNKYKISKFGNAEFLFLSTSIYPLRSIYIQSFMLISFVVLELFPGQDLFKRGDNSKIWQNRVIFL